MVEEKRDRHISQTPQHAFGSSLARMAHGKEVRSGQPSVEDGWVRGFCPVYISSAAETHSPFALELKPSGPAGHRLAR
ncbi:uncharacterized protein N7469_004428 [Penicillium citrinum]|uniref:Uncharacterized protein n=2 Tax=Penicillium TaxID=5073 RepID=A0A9W9P507_PENCI|nr:uncharacterized protein N7469_004428 [Penicillium citrinum]KAJ5235260.1 hypothetical protein N7469_004428 [Penicillium citrinum]KAJ5590887.1 hypothetical protein N7450_004859 [Penicillium hetheringtonii]